MELISETASYCRKAREAALSNDFPLAASYYEEAERLGGALPAEEDETLLSIADYYGERDDYAAASVWYGKIRDTNLIEAFTLYYIGKLYREGDIVGQDDAAALYWFRLAAAREEPIALWTLGLLHRDGQCGVTADLDEAERLMQHACLLGADYSDSLKELPVLYERKYGPAYVERTLAFYEQLAERPNDYEKHYELGVCYESGYHAKLDIRVEPDPVRAFRHYRRSVEKSTHSRAAYRLGVFYQQGIGTAPDPEEAARIFKTYASANEDAANALGECYFNGAGVERDLDKTFFYCSRAAERGHAEAQYNVGFC